MLLHNKQHAKTTPPANLSQPSVSLPGQAGDPPSGDNTLCTLTLGDGNGVKHLIGLEYRVHTDCLLKQIVAKVYLLLNAASVDLNSNSIEQQIGTSSSLGLQHAMSSCVLNTQVLSTATTGQLSL